jgi:hypothetical protein
MRLAIWTAVARLRLLPRRLRVWVMDIIVEAGW